MSCGVSQLAKHSAILTVPQLGTLATILCLESVFL
jgi:hypothetical protein